MEAEVKIQELRLDNLLKRGDDIVVVSAIFRSHFNCDNYENGIDYGNNHQNNYQPIPLTEEWLLKLGFEHTKTDAPMWINSFCINIPARWGNRLVIEAKVEDSEYGGIEAYLILTHARALRVEKKYRYVHEVQNLYYALTQTELQLAAK